MDIIEQTTVEKTQEEIDSEFWANIDKRKETITSKLGKKVFPIVVVDRATGDYIVGFAYEPDLTTRLRLMDKSSGIESGISVEACSQVLESLILDGETDPRITDKNKNPEAWIGASYCLAQFMSSAIPVFKKK